MKNFCYLLVIALAFGATRPAQAYRINVLDPVSTNYITTQPFNIVLEPCTNTEIPYSSTPGTHGCFSGINSTVGTITTLEIVFPIVGSLTGQTLVCSPTAASLFNASSCGTYGGFQVFFFSGMNIPIGDAFLIVEEGLNPTSPDGGPTFPPAVGTFPPSLVIPSPVPEPSSIVLLSTGLMIGAFFFARKKGLLSSSSHFGVSGS